MWGFFFYYYYYLILSATITYPFVLFPPLPTVLLYLFHWFTAHPIKIWSLSLANCHSQQNFISLLCSICFLVLYWTIELFYPATCKLIWLCSLTWTLPCFFTGHTKHYSLLSCRFPERDKFLTKSVTQQHQEKQKTEAVVVEPVYCILKSIFNFCLSSLRILSLPLNLIILLRCSSYFIILGQF